MRKILLIMRKISNSKQVDSVSFLGYSISKEGIASTRSQICRKNENEKSLTNNKQLESFVGLANFYGRMIPDFATIMLTLNNKKNNDFSWVKLQQTTFADIKSELCASPILLPYSLQKEATVTTDASAKKILSGFARRTSSYICLYKLYLQLYTQLYI